MSGRAFLKKKLDIDSLVFSGLVVVFSLSWGLAARFYPAPGIPYASIAFSQLNHSVQIVAKNLIDAVYLSNVVMVILAACLLKIVTFSSAQKAASSGSTRNGLIVMMILVFSGAWTLLFSINSWVAANSFHFRYFVPLIFVGMMLLSFEVRNIAVFLSRRQRYALSVLLASWLIVHLTQPFVFLRDYSVFNRIDAVLTDNIVGYAGDYWSVWPAVMKKLFERKESFGFTFRAVGNQENLKRHFKEAGPGSGCQTIGCLKAPIDQCLSQIRGFLGNVGLDHAELVGDNFWLLHIYFMNEPL